MTSPIYFGDHDDNGVLRIDLPDRIGYVEIRTGMVNAQSGYPAITVGVVSATENTPAADGRLYERMFKFDGSQISLVGKPGPRLLEQQRQVKWFEKIITMHDSGDHTECPETCPAKEG